MKFDKYIAYLVMEVSKVSLSIKFSVNCETTNQIKLNLIKCWFLRGGENRSTWGETFQSGEENQQILEDICGRRVLCTLPCSLAIGLTR